MTRALTLALLLLCFPVLADSLRVVDGDTLVLDGERIRLEGIDAPEKTQSCYRDGIAYPCGLRAKEALERLVRGLEMCQEIGRDRYGRVLGTCYAGGVNINAALVSSGWALAYRRYSTAYVGEEEEARENRRGMWAGEFMEPWEWRKRN